jgi:hypothetical protein
MLSKSTSPAGRKKGGPTGRTRTRIQPRQHVVRKVCEYVPDVWPNLNSATNAVRAGKLFAAALCLRRRDLGKSPQNPGVIERRNSVELQTLARSITLSGNALPASCSLKALEAQRQSFAIRPIFVAVWQMDGFAIQALQRLSIGPSLWISKRSDT